MELAGDRPRDQISLFSDSEAFQSSIGRRDQCLRRCSFDVGCAKDRTERKRRPSPELRSASRRGLCAARWNTSMRRTGHLFELPAPNPMRSVGQKLDDQGGCHDQKSERWAFEAFVQNKEREPRPGGSFRPRLQYRPNNYATRPALRRSSQLFPAFVWGTLAHKVARKRRSIDKLDAEDGCIA